MPNGRRPLAFVMAAHDRDTEIHLRLLKLGRPDSEPEIRTFNRAGKGFEPYIGRCQTKCAEVRFSGSVSEKPDMELVGG